MVCLGLILDEQGQKMSKSRGNTVEPWSVIERHGADAFRWYFFTAKAPWDGYRFSDQTIGEGVRLFLKQLWSTYFFYVLYAHAGAEQLAGAPEQPASSDPLEPASVIGGRPERLCADHALGRSVTSRGRAPSPATVGPVLGQRAGTPQGTNGIRRIVGWVLGWPGRGVAPRP